MLPRAVALALLLAATTFPTSFPQRSFAQNSLAQNSPPPCRNPDACLPLALANHPDAQYQLALMLYDGLQTPQNFPKAAQWFHSAARLGHVDAQSFIGFLHLFGEGVPKDHALALAWLLVAAENGDKLAAQALHNLNPHVQSVIDARLLAASIKETIQPPKALK